MHIYIYMYMCVCVCVCVCAFTIILIYNFSRLINILLRHINIFINFPELMTFPYIYFDTILLIIRNKVSCFL